MDDISAIVVDIGPRSKAAASKGGFFSMCMGGEA